MDCSSWFWRSGIWFVRIWRSYGARVVAVDNRVDQIDFINARIAAIKNGNYNSFFHQGILEQSFFGLEKCEMIRRNLCLLTVLEGDIVDVCESKTGFNKVYLSNALTNNDKHLFFNLKRISGHLPLGGLVYAANGEEFIEVYEQSGFACDQGLTNLAYQPCWNPVVLRKIAEPEQ